METQQVNGILEKKSAPALTVAPFPWQQLLVGILTAVGPLVARWLITTITSNAGAPAAADEQQNPPT